MARKSDGLNDDIKQSHASVLDWDATDRTWHGWADIPSSISGGSGGARYFYTKMGSGSSFPGFELVIIKSSGVIRTTVRSSGNQNNPSTSTRDVRGDGWISWGCTRDRTDDDWKQYVDGVLDPSSLTTDLDADASNSGGPIMYDHINVQNSGRVWMDSSAHFAMWDSSLTDEQMKALSHGVNPFALEPDIFYLPLWGNESTEQDYTGNGHNGTVNEATKTPGPPVELIENYL